MRYYHNLERRKFKFSKNAQKSVSPINGIGILFKYFKSNVSLYSLYYAEVCNEFAKPISASLHPGNTASLEEMLQRWQTVGNTCVRFEPQTFRSRDELATVRRTFKHSN